MIKNCGFSMIELLITVLIVGILTLISYPLYIDYIRRGYRSDATQTAFGIQLAQEKWRATHSTYGTLANVWGGITTTASGRYALALSGVSASGYTLTATAQGGQVGDAVGGTSCNTLTVVVSNTVLTTTPAACW